MKTRVPGELTAIDDINNEKEVVDWPNPLMKDLQNACRLSNFSVDYLLTEAKNMTDREYERSMDRKEARAEGLEMDAKLRKFVAPSNGLSSGF